MVTTTIRLGIWGAGCTGALGLLIALVAVAFSDLSGLPRGAETAQLLRALPPTAILCAIAIDAALLCYFVGLIKRQLVAFRRSEMRLLKQLSEITLLQEAISSVHDLRSQDALQRVVEIVTHVLGFQRAPL